MQDKSKKSDKHLHNTLTRVEISGKAFREYGIFNMKQIYNNVNQEEIESIYRFKLPYNSVVKRMKFKNNNGDVIVAELMECWEAQRRYDEGVSAGHGIIVVEALGSDAYAVTIGRHMRGDRLEIDVEYYYEFGDALGHSRLIIPLVYVPAPVSDTDNSTSDVWVDKTDYNATLNVEIMDMDSICDITSPSHEIEINYSGVFPGVVFSGKEVVMDRDLVIDMEYNLAEKDKVYAYKTEDGKGVAYYSIDSGVEGVEENLPKNLIFILDSTSSMLGEKLKNAKTAVWLSLKELKDTQRFNIFAVNDEVRPFSLNPRNIDTRAIDNAISWLEKVECNNGMSILDALFEVIDRGQNKDSHIVVLTDGRTNKQFDIMNYLKKNFSDTPVSVLGFDIVMEKKFLTDVAAITGGQVAFIYPEERLGVKIKNAFKNIFAPYVEGVSVMPLWSKINDIFPQIFTKVIQGERLLFMIGYDEVLPVNIALSNKDGKWKRVVEIVDVNEFSSFDMLDYVFNMRKVRFLQNFLNNVDDTIQSKVKNEILQLAMNAGILCEQTALYAMNENTRENVPMLFKKDIPLQKTKFLEEFAISNSIFNEIKVNEYRTGLWKVNRIKLCARVILKCQREDGCIAGLYQYKGEDCARVTALSMIAVLLYAEKKEKYANMINRAIDYLLNYMEGDGFLTNEIIIAFKMSSDCYLVSGDKLSRVQNIINRCNGVFPTLDMLSERLGSMEEMTLAIDECKREEEVVEFAAKCVILLNTEK